MSKKVSSRIVFEDYIYQYDTRKKDTEYYFCIYKKKTGVLHVVLNLKTILNLHGCSISVKPQK